MCNVRVLSYILLGQNEDYSPRDSISDSSEKLLQRGRGKVSIHVIFMKGGATCNQAYIYIYIFFFFQIVSASLVRATVSHEEQISP